MAPPNASVTVRSDRRGGDFSQTTTMKMNRSVYSGQERPACSREYLRWHFAFNIRQADIAPGESVRQARVIDAHTVQNGRVQIVNGELILHHVVAIIIGRPIHRAPFDSAA